MAATRDLAKKLNPLWKYLYYWEAGGSLWTKSKTNWDLYSAVINLHDVQLMQQLHTHQFKCIQTADCGIWQQCVHSDVTQGCSDTRRRLRPPQLKTITAGISLPLFFTLFCFDGKKRKCLYVGSILSRSPCLCTACSLLKLHWHTNAITGRSRLRQDTAHKLVAHSNVGHFYFSSVGRNSALSRIQTWNPQRT